MRVEVYWIARKAVEVEWADDAFDFARHLLREHPNASVYLDGEPFTAAYMNVESEEVRGS